MAILRNRQQQETVTNDLDAPYGENHINASAHMIVAEDHRVLNPRTLKSETKKPVAESHAGNRPSTPANKPKANKKPNKSARKHKDYDVLSWEEGREILRDIATQWGAKPEGGAYGLDPEDY